LSVSGEYQVFMPNLGMSLFLLEYEICAKELIGLPEVVMAGSSVVRPLTEEKPLENGEPIPERRGEFNFDRLPLQFRFPTLKVNGSGAVIFPVENPIPKFMVSLFIPIFVSKSELFALSPYE